MGKAKNGRLHPSTDQRQLPWLQEGAGPCWGKDAQISPWLQKRSTSWADAVRSYTVSKESSAPGTKHRGKSRPASVSSPHPAADS